MNGGNRFKNLKVLQVNSKPNVMKILNSPKVEYLKLNHFQRSYCIKLKSGHPHFKI